LKKGINGAEAIEIPAAGEENKPRTIWWVISAGYKDEWMSFISPTQACPRGGPTHIDFPPDYSAAELLAIAKLINGGRELSLQRRGQVRPSPIYIQRRMQLPSSPNARLDSQLRIDRPVMRQANPCSPTAASGLTKGV